MDRSIGLNVVKFLQLKIKEAVGHAGHSAQLQSYNHLLYQKVKRWIFLNSNLLTAAIFMEIQVVMEGSIHKDQPMYETMESQRLPIIHMLPKINFVKFMGEILRLQRSIQLKDAIIQPMPFWKGPLELELMPLIGVNMPQEFSATVEIISIIMCSQSVSQAAFTKSKIHGAHLGEKKDSSALLLETHAEFAQTNLHGFNDRSHP